MIKTSTTKRIIRTIALIALSSLVFMIFTACSSAASNQVSYVGPKIEDIRQMYTVERDGSNPVQLFPYIRDLGTSLIWYPNGDKTIVFAELEQEFYIGDVKNGRLGDCLTCSIDEFGGPAISPDGETIAWGTDEGLYLMGADGSGLRKLADIAKPGWLSWSSDGNFLVFAFWGHRLEIHRFDIEDATLHLLTSYDGSENADHFAPSWSPTGDQIAFHILNRNGLRIMVMDADGSNLAEVITWTTTDEIFDPGLQQPPQWSSNGEQLAFSSRSPLDNMDIFVVNLDGSGLTNLTNQPGHDVDPVWSPDGKYIAFVSNRDGNHEIYVMNADGSEQCNISNSPLTNEFNPAWQPKLSE